MTVSIQRGLQSIISGIAEEILEGASKIPDGVAEAPTEAQTVRIAIRGLSGCAAYAARVQVTEAQRIPKGVTPMDSLWSHRDDIGVVLLAMTTYYDFLLRFKPSLRDRERIYR